MPDNTYEYFCYCCGKLYRETASVQPTQCCQCSSTDIQSQFFKCNLIATTDPTVNDDITESYCVGSKWINTSTGSIFKCVDNTEGAAVWSDLEDKAVLEGIMDSKDDAIKALAVMLGGRPGGQVIRGGSGAEGSDDLYLYANIGGTPYIILRQGSYIRLESASDIFLDTNAAGIHQFRGPSDVVRMLLDGSGNLNPKGNVTMETEKTVDGRDVSIDGAKLDGIDTGADVTGDNEAGSVEGTNIKSTGVTEGYVPKAQGDGTVLWEAGGSASGSAKSIERVVPMGITLGSNTAGYFMWGRSDTYTSSEANAQVSMPVCRVVGLRGHVTAYAGTVSFTVRKNGEDTGITGTISATGHFNFNNSGTPIELSDEDLLSIAFSVGAGGSVTLYGIHLILDSEVA